MKTGNFDVVLEIHEEFINKALAALFYSGFMYRKKEWIPSTEKLPASIKNLLKVKYELRLKGEPLIDFISNTKVRILISAEAYLVLLDGYQVEVDINFSIEGTISYDKSKKQLMLDLTEARLSDFDINDKYDLPEKVLHAVNEILRLIVIENLTGKWEIINVREPLFSTKLPKMPPGDENKLPIKISGFRVFDSKVIACCFNLLQYDGGNINNVSDFTNGNNYAVGINENAIHRVFDFWWDRTTFPKTIIKKKTYDVPVIDTFLDFIADVVDIGVKLATLGFLETDFEVDDVWIEYGAKVTLLKPDFDLKDGNIIEIKNSSVKVSVWATAKAKVTASIEVDTSGLIPDWLTPWEDDVELSSQTSTMTLFALALNDINAEIEKASGKVTLDSNNQLVGEIEEIDVEVDLGDEWYSHLPEAIINKILDFVENLVLEKIKSFVLFPAFIVKKIPKTNLNLEVDINLLDVDDPETIIAADVDVKELKSPVIPVPRYIANSNPKSKEVHLSECISVQRMDEKNKVGYYVLYDAFRDGYDGCKKCIPKYHTR